MTALDEAGESQVTKKKIREGKPNGNIVNGERAAE